MRLTRRLLVVALLFSALPAVATPEDKPAALLIVADEIPAMETLAKELEARVHERSEIVTQDKLPASLAGYKAVLVYIHKELGEPAENAFLDYAEAGGKLILLHHSISSQKRKNKRLFPALGIELRTGEFLEGAYKYFDDAAWDIVNLAPGSPVTTRGVKYPDKVEWLDGRARPGFHPEATEVYLNHVLTGPRTVLLGLRYLHPESGRLFVQDTVGWEKKTGKGRVFYFMPGHRAKDFQNPLYAQILANAVAAK
jgi:hypothetical protein